MIKVIKSKWGIEVNNKIKIKKLEKCFFVKALYINIGSSDMT